jgi:hypothetical protein
MEKVLFSTQATAEIIYTENSMYSLLGIGWNFKSFGLNVWKFVLIFNECTFVVVVH